MKIVNTYKRPVLHGFIHAVLSLDEANKYAVYLGLNNNENEILKHGVKCSFDEAIIYFPMLKKDSYRL